jgi:hypothetical protein
MEIYGNLQEYNTLVTYLNELIEFNEKISSKGFYQETIIVTKWK